MYKAIKRDPDILQAPLRILRYHQLWPKLGENLSDPWPMTKLIIILVSLNVTLVGSVYHLYHAFKNPDTMNPVDVLMDVQVIFAFITIYYTVYSLVIHVEELQQFIHDLSDYRRFGKPPLIDEVNKRCNWFTYFFYCYGCTGWLTFASQGLLEKGKCLAADEDHTRVCGFLLPQLFPFPLRPWWVFAVMWLVETFTMLVVFQSGIIIMTFIYSSVEIYVTKIIHMRDEILKLGERPEEGRQRIKFCVEYHVMIIEMGENLNICWGKLMLYHQLLVTVMLSLIGIQCLLKPEPQPVMYAIGWVVSLSIPCYAGQRLLDESMLIPWAMYSSRWYDLDNRHAKAVNFMIMRGNNYLDLNRDGYGPMNLSIVGQVANNIYSILTLLYGTMKE